MAQSPCDDISHVRLQVCPDDAYNDCFRKKFDLVFTNVDPLNNDPDFDVARFEEIIIPIQGNGIFDMGSTLIHPDLDNILLSETYSADRRICTLSTEECSNLNTHTFDFDDCPIVSAPIMTFYVIQDPVTPTIGLNTPTVTTLMHDGSAICNEVCDIEGVKSGYSTTYLRPLRGHRGTSNTTLWSRRLYCPGPLRDTY